MFSKILNDPENQSCIKVNHRNDEKVTIAEITMYNIVLLHHTGSLEFNFDKEVLDGKYIAFLCPGEVLQIRNFKRLTTISFPIDSPIRESEGFSYAFGNIKKFFQLTDEVFKELHQISEKLLTLEKFKPIFWKNKSNSILQEVLRLSPTYTDSPNSKDYPLIYSFVSLVHEHYTMHHEISYYAKLLNIPAKRITEKFNALGIESPHNFIKKRIVTEIKRQLIFTDKTLKNICFDVGFNDPAYFSRFFKKNVGVTAKEYRQTKQSG